MILFKFTPGEDPTNLRGGQTIIGATSKMWVERYNEPGAFEIVSPLSAGLKEFLPTGTMICHQDSYEVMIVENHEITEDPETDPVLKTTGRSFVSYLEQRMIAAGISRGSPIIGDYGSIEVVETLPVQITNLINSCIHPSEIGAEGDDLGDIIATYEADVGTTLARTFKPQVLWERVKELLTIDGLGIRTIRRNEFGVLGSDSQTQIQVYSGVDRSDSVVFSWQTGEIEQAQYLFTIKNLKNAAFVVSRYLYYVVEGTETGYDRRFMYVDAADLDNNLTEVPTGDTLTALLASMTVRGQEAISNQTTIELLQADVANIHKYRYRVDFNVGDLIKLDGNFGAIATMRVTEYTEIEDASGVSMHPTLALPGV